MTQLREGEPGNDVLAAQLERTMRQLRDEEEDDEGKTFRAVVSEKFRGFEKELESLKSQQQQMYWILVGGVVVNVALRFVGTG